MNQKRKLLFLEHNNSVTVSFIEPLAIYLYNT